jgi:hypothetical protein
MLTALLVVLSAAPVEVLVVLPASARPAALKVAPEGRTFVDGSALYEHLLAPTGMFGFQDFEAFTEAPVAGWPVALKDVWTGGLAYCLDVSGPPPWRQTLPGGRCCGRRLGFYLWDRYLTSLPATDVFILQTSVTKSDGVVVRGTRSTPEGVDQLVVSQSGPVGTEDRVVGKVFAKLLANDGSRETRTVVNRLFVAEPGDPWRQQSPPVPLELKQRCDRLPAGLKFKAPSPTSQALQERWAAAAKGAGPELECSLQFSSHEELPDEAMLMPLTVVTSVLRCGEVTVSHELARSSLVKAPIDAVTGGLAQSLAARLCR